MGPLQVEIFCSPYPTYFFGLLRHVKDHIDNRGEWDAKKTTPGVLVITGS